MENFKIGDIVARKSYNMDVFFRIIRISGKVADLVGVTVRISADSNLSDLVHISNEQFQNSMKRFEQSRNIRMDRCYQNVKRNYNIRNEVYTNPTVFTREKM